ncbi:hypothetical protein RRG08_023390, partial [Elysia crispata]
HQAHKSGLLKCQVTKSELPEQLRSYLNTTCDDDCIGTAIPEIGERTPLAPLWRLVPSLAPCLMSLSPQTS